MQRTDLMDTSEWAYKEMVRRLRLLTPEQRLQMVIERVDMGREIQELARQRLAEADEAKSEIWS